MESEKELPVGEQPVDVEHRLPETETPSASAPGAPSHKRQSWGVLISIIIIVAMVVIGAFYAWGKRIAQQNAIMAPAAIQ